MSQTLHWFRELVWFFGSVCCVVGAVRAVQVLWIQVLGLVSAVGETWPIA